MTQELVGNGRQAEYLEKTLQKMFSHSSEEEEEELKSLKERYERYKKAYVKHLKFDPEIPSLSRFNVTNVKQL